MKLVAIRIADALGVSLPVRGAWVEIYDYLAGCDGAPVAPRAGSVG